jgi:hypothetical protein
MDYAFKVNVLNGQLEREFVPPPVYDHDDNDGGLDVSSSCSDSDLCSINLFLC